MHEDPLGRHADLAAVHERTKRAASGRFVEIGVLKYDGGGFAAEFHQDRFEVFAGGCSDDAADGGAAGVIYLFYKGMFDYCGCDFGRILGAVEEDVEAGEGWNVRNSLWSWSWLGMWDRLLE